LLAGLVFTNTADSQAVKVTGGLVSGVPGASPSMVTYKGIPFAAPPVGNLRWRAPQPVVSWTGVLKAEMFSASCIQRIVKEMVPWTYEFMTHNEVSEDCLYLNVCTPAKSASAKLPVFVYIYGGGFDSGSGAVPVYDGEGLAKKGLVVVTFNYRVGALGFLAHPELTKESGNQSSGNYGLLDQIAALRWVHENIASFGGDENNVTIAGQSAGSISVHDLTASPLARGLFHRAIAESGGSTVGGAGISVPPTRLAVAESTGLKFAESKGAKSLVELRALRWQQIQASEQGPGNAQGFRFGPIVDGYVLPAPFMEVIAQGKQSDVATLTGANAGELAEFSDRPELLSPCRCFKTTRASAMATRPASSSNSIPRPPMNKPPPRNEKARAIRRWSPCISGPKFAQRQQKQVCSNTCGITPSPARCRSLRRIS